MWDEDKIEIFEIKGVKYLWDPKNPGMERLPEPLRINRQQLQQYQTGGSLPTQPDSQHHAPQQ